MEIIVGLLIIAAVIWLVVTIVQWIAANIGAILLVIAGIALVIGFIKAMDTENGRKAFGSVAFMCAVLAGIVAAVFCAGLATVGFATPLDRTACAIAHVAGSGPGSTWAFVWGTAGVVLGSLGGMGVGLWNCNRQGGALGAWSGAVAVVAALAFATSASDARTWPTGCHPAEAAPEVASGTTTAPPVPPTADAVAIANNGAAVSEAQGLIKLSREKLAVDPQASLAAATKAVELDPQNDDAKVVRTAAEAAVSQMAKAPEAPAAPPEKKEEAKKEEKKEAPKVEARTPPAAARSITEAELVAFVQSWLNTQNRGDFAEYRALYAPAFSGVRRSGGKTFSLNHAGWIADREKMFHRPMTVGFSNFQVIAAGPSAARIRFTQDWASGSYHDTGPKDMTLTRINGVLRISHEELLYSTVL